jgi:UDP-N-acetylmuramate: L-alanyl-gamma-D-glutamyl-meso-diaminopimelate ligase
MGKKAHFIGIAGMGMSAVAILLKEQGWKVTGSDTEAYPPATTQLAEHEIPFNTVYKATNIPKDADVIIIGKNAKVTRVNPEVATAHESGIRIASFPEILGELVKERSPIVVAGSYGKSTTTSLMAWLLSQSGVDAGWFIGAAPHAMEPGHLGTHKAFILEGDEYPTSHEDSRAKFAHYRAHDALITAASHDHVNIYKTQEDFVKPFETLVSELPEDGILMLCTDEPHAATLAKHTKARVVTYGIADPLTDWHATNIAVGETTTFDLVHKQKKVATLETNLIGEHNVQNIVGAAGLLIEKKWLTAEQIAKALKEFKGLARRLDKKTFLSRVPAYEGFGSSREKLQAAIQAMKQMYPDERLIVVFEPHTFSWRNKNMLHWFDTAFMGANIVLLYKPAEQGSDTHEQSSHEEMAKRLTVAHIAVETASTPKDALDMLGLEIAEGDVILLSSSGPMDGLIESIPKWLDNTFS